MNDAEYTPEMGRSELALLAVVVGAGTSLLVDVTSPSAEGAPPISVLAKAQMLLIPFKTPFASVVFRKEVWFVFSKLR